MRMAVAVASAPPSTHTSVETRLTLMPARRAASAFSADARIAMPYGVRFMKIARPTITAGTNAMTKKCCPFSTRLPIVICRWIPVGYGAT